MMNFANIQSICCERVLFVFNKSQPSLLSPEKRPDFLLTEIEDPDRLHQAS